MENENVKGWVPYILFVITSSVVGFGLVYAICRAVLHIMPQTAFFLSIIAALIYIVLCAFLRAILREFFLSELFLYLYFGFLTTVINNVLFYSFNEKLLVNYFEFSETNRILIAQVVSFIAAVLFAYITNKFFVFKSFILMPGELLREIFQFFGARIITFIIETLGILLLVKAVHISDMISKIIMSVICIIINYIVSKLFIFKDKVNENN